MINSSILTTLHILQSHSNYSACTSRDDLRASGLHIWCWHVWNGADQRRLPLWCRYLCRRWVPPTFRAGIRPSLPPGKVFRWNCQKAQGLCLKFVHLRFEGFIKNMNRQKMPWIKRTLFLFDLFRIWNLEINLNSVVYLNIIIWEICIVPPESLFFYD